jgi:histidinol-phosphatase (PHP family)
MNADKVGQYLDDVATARERHPGLEVICGCEVDWRYGAEQYIRDRIGPYELILGSVHMITSEDGEAWEFDHPDYIRGWSIRGVRKVWQEYYELWMQAVYSTIPFDIMSHPDLPKKLGFKPDFDTTDMYRNMAAAAAACERMVEVNTSGLHKPVAELYPSLELLKCFCDAGVPCTVSSDAHRPEHVGRDLDKGYDAMRAAGYTHYTVPTRDGDRRTVAL